MLTPSYGWSRIGGRIFGVDTGCFAQPDQFDPDKYIAFLQRCPYDRQRCLFATAPDRFGDGRATLRLARPMLPRIRECGFPAAFVAQPGITTEDIPWPELDALFIGGPNDWQFSRVAWALAATARRLGKHVHRGRVNSLKRLQDAQVQGCHSADGTYAAYEPDNHIPQIARWVTVVTAQQPLFRVMETI